MHRRRSPRRRSFAGRCGHAAALAQEDTVITDPNTDGELVVGVELEPRDNFLMRLWKTEPAMVIGFVSALLALLVAFNAPITADQTVKTVAFAGVAWPLIQSLAIRSQVSPVSKVEAIESEADAAITEAYHAGIADATAEASVLRPAIG